MKNSTFVQSKRLTVFILMFSLCFFSLFISIPAWARFAVVFTQHPSATSACVNSSASFSVVATGSGTLTYQWQESTNGGTTYNNLASSGVYSGTATFMLNISSVTAGMNSYRYRCIVTDISGSTPSNPAILTVNSLPTVQTANVSHTICAAGGGTLTAQFFAGQTYQWQVSTDVGSSWNNISDGGSYAGSATDVLFISNAAALDGTLYRYIATVTGGCQAISGIDTLHVLQPVINTQPVASTVCVGGTAAYTVDASSPVALTYQWQLGTTSLTNNAMYSNVTTPTLTISGVTAAMDRQLYRVAIRDTLLCLTNSSQVRLFVIAPPVINTQPQDVTTCAGLTATFTVAATSATVSGNAARTYQWQTDNGSAGVSWSNISSATSTSLSLSAVTTAMNGYRYRVIVTTGTCGNVTSNGVTLTVRSSGTWLGAVDTNWHVPGNWCGGVPVSTTDVLVPNWAPRMPTISDATGTAFSRSLVIENNAKLTISGGTTSMSGPFNIPGTVAYIAIVDQPVLPADHGSLMINGSGNKLLQVNTAVSHNLVLGGLAKLVTGNHILTMKDGSAPVSGASYGGSWIVTGNGSSGAANTGLGGLRYEQVNVSKGPVLYPVGPTSLSYNPAILFNTGIADDIMIAVNDQVIPGSYLFAGTDRTWLVSESITGGSSINLALAWNGTEEGSMFRRGQSEIIRSNGTSIMEYSGTDSATGLDPYALASTYSFTDLTQFSVASYVNLIVLPIKIKSFVAVKLQETSVRLLWETGGAFENATHTVQRSTDGYNFTNIGAVTGEEGRTTYTLLDNQYNNNTAWYRLRIKTIDGKNIYSHTVKVTGEDTKDRIELRPSITQSTTTNLFIVAPRKEKSVMRLLDASGKVLSQHTYELEKGENTIPIKIDHLQKGVYYMHIVMNAQRTQVLRLIKQ